MASLITGKTNTTLGSVNLFAMWDGIVSQSWFSDSKNDSVSYPVDGGDLIYQYSSDMTPQLTLKVLVSNSDLSTLIGYKTKTKTLTTPMGSATVLVRAITDKRVHKGRFSDWIVTLELLKL